MSVRLCSQGGDEKGLSQVFGVEYFCEHMIVEAEQNKNRDRDEGRRDEVVPGGRTRFNSSSNPVQPLPPVLTLRVNVAGETRFNRRGAVCVFCRKQSREKK